MVVLLLSVDFDAFSFLFLLPKPHGDLQVWMMEAKKIFDTGGMPKWEVRRFFWNDRSGTAHVNTSLGQ